VKVLAAFGHRCHCAVVWGGKGVGGMGEWSGVGVLRLRLSQRSREASLRMTEFGGEWLARSIYQRRMGWKKTQVFLV
jgi:hypothetical protein